MSEIVIFVIAGLFVLLFALIYLIFKRFFDTRLQLKAMEPQPTTNTDQKYLKIQAYERLILFCERVNLPTLLLRIRTKEMNANSLCSALILAIQQEYEHNVTQQLYTSDQLWTIISLAKNQMIEIISQVKESLPTEASGEKLHLELMDYYSKEERLPIETAKSAIKKEAGLLF